VSATRIAKVNVRETVAGMPDTQTEPDQRNGAK
jgi:hypothetical protein